jgi:hypothetical protein
MKSIPSRVALILAGAIVPALLVVLTACRPEYCGPVDISRSHAEAAASTSARTPTLAPPQNLVVVRVESDRPDIKIGWAEN